MTIGLICCWFHNPSILTDHHKSLEYVFRRQLIGWREYIDEITFVDSNWGLDLASYDTAILKRPGNSHWAGMKEVSERSTSDVLLFVDQDMLIYDPEIIKQMKWEIEENKADVCSILDSSGKVQLFTQNEFRRSRARLCPYLCMIKRNLVSEIGYDFDPDPDHDTMGKMTEKLLSLHPDLHILEIPDDRFSVYLRNGEIVANTNLDGRGFSWSEPEDKETNRGYYHIRNATLGIEMIEEYFSNEDSYRNRKAMSPDWEVFRAMSWWYIFDQIEGNYAGLQRIQTVVNDFGVSKELWNTYINTIREKQTWVSHL